MAALEETDAAFAAGAPEQRPPEPARARRWWLLLRPRAPRARQRDLLHAQLRRHPLIRGGGKPAIGHGQSRRLAKELLMFDQGRFPQLLIRHPRRADRVIRHEPGLRLLDL